VSRISVTFVWLFLFFLVLQINYKNQEKKCQKYGMVVKKDKGKSIAKGIFKTQGLSNPYIQTKKELTKISSMIGRCYQVM